MAKGNGPKTDGSLSIVVVSHGKVALLRECLTALGSVSPGALDAIYVVDNCSKDGSAQMVRSEFPHVQLMENERPLGFGANNNRALRSVQSEYVLLVNDDTVVLPGAVEAMLDFLHAHRQVGAVGCRLLFPDMSLQRSTASEPTLLRELVRAQPLLRNLTGSPRFVHLIERFIRRFLPREAEAFWRHDKEREVEHVMAACAMIRVAALREVGLFDENFHMYFEDIDLFLRMRRQGWKIVFLPNPAAIHHLGASTGQRQHRRTANAMLVEWYRSLFYFYAKYRSARNARVLRAVMAVNFSLLFLWESVLSLLPGYGRSSRAAARVYAEIVRISLRPRAWVTTGGAPLPAAWTRMKEVG